MIKQAFKRLWHDERGNTLVLAAAVTIPLLGLIGSGVDLSRFYLAKNKLQQACDAGVLAGRKVMTNGIDANVTSEVQKFVNFNFPQNTLQTTAFTATPTTVAADRTVDLTLATRVPTAIMQLFGITGLDISVSCTARQDFINTDVMLVLDTTLSMNCIPSAGALDYCTSETANSKIVALRAAVVSFYAALRPAQLQLEAAGLRLRYGIVPYSMTVNTGKLDSVPVGGGAMSLINRGYIRTNPQYQQTCTTSGCTEPNFNTVNRDNTWLNSTNWRGCIEERGTVATINASTGFAIPANAHDLNVDLVPTDDATRWAPYDPASATAKTGLAGIDSACPREARRMAAFATQADLETYLSTMTAGGYTYHDIGMIWAARLMSQTGLWGGENPAAFGGFPVNRHLIFMTDGALNAEPNSYSAYGVARYATGGRRTSNGTQGAQDITHNQRLRMMCNRIRALNPGNGVNIWVIAFGTSAATGLTPEVRNCANSPAQAFTAANSAGLNASFQQIAQSIGALRLSQ